LGLARLYGRITIAHAHSSDKYNEDSYLQHIVRWGLYCLTRHVAQYFFACSKEAGLVRYGEKIVISKRFAVWHNAIDYKRFSYQPTKRKKVRENLGISNDCMVIGHVGRLTWAKNHEFLLQVFSEFHKRHSNSVLLLVGDGERREELELLVNRVGLDQAVIFTGGVSNVEDYMNAMDLFLFPSHYEGLGIVNIEAQVNGLPCIISDKVSREVDVSAFGKVKFFPLEEIKVWIRELEKKRIFKNRIGGKVEYKEYNIQYAVQWAEHEYKKIVSGGNLYC
jgi:glycosyltransferase involved in cell wall biosynthesis